MPLNSTEKFLNWATPDSFKTADKQYIGIDGFRLFVELSSTADFTATAPRFVTEDLKTAQDSIINEPKTLTIVGEVADINLTKESEEGFGDVFQKVLNEATPYLPDRTLSQIQKVEEFASEIDNTIQRIDNFAQGAFRTAQSLGFMPGIISTQTNKERFFNHIERLYDQKIPPNIDTLYRSYENWAITSFSYTETNEGDEGTFTITFEELRIVDVSLFRNNQELTPAEDAKKNVNTTLDGQLDSSTNKGISNGTLISPSQADAILNGIGF